MARPRYCQLKKHFLRGFFVETIVTARVGRLRFVVCTLAIHAQVVLLGKSEEKIQRRRTRVSDPYRLLQRHGLLLRVSPLVSPKWSLASNIGGGKAMTVFDERYRVVKVEGDRLLVRGVHSGDVLTIFNSEPAI